MFDEFCSGFAYCSMHLAMHLLASFSMHDYTVFNIRCMLLKVCEYVTLYSKPRLNLFRFRNAFLCAYLLSIIVHAYTHIQYVKQSQIYCHKLLKAFNISAYHMTAEKDDKQIFAI